MRPVSLGTGRQGGFTLLGLLFLVAVLGLGLAAVGTLWETVLRREKEAELLFVGNQYRLALESYYRASPGQEKRFPATLKDLLGDKRFPHTVRHLRRLYRDPITNDEEWGLVKRGEEIIGVYSLSPGTPMKQAGFPKIFAEFEEQQNYQGWVFQVSKDLMDPQASPGLAGSQGKSQVETLPGKPKI